MRYGVVGSKGKMGREVIEYFNSCGDELVLEVDVGHFSERGRPDVIVDFSSPEALFETCALAEKFGAHVVVGTTALKDEHFQRLRELSKHVVVVQSYNFSQGIAVLRLILERFGPMLAGWDAAIVETHHTQKKDAPSGTALLLKNALGRELNISSLRLGGVFGEHSVIFANAGEVLEFKHNALSRRVFAMGARSAALFTLSAEPGFYSFIDVVSSTNAQ